LFLATEFNASQRGHEQCQAEATAVNGWSAVSLAGALSPEDNDAPEVGWFATSLRRLGLDTFHHERNAA
jgi:hypothetical protein